MDVIVYGTGNYGQDFFHNYSKEHNIIFWIDGNKEKQGKLFYGRETKSPEVLKEYLDIPVIIALFDKYGIRRKLIELGCKSLWKYSPFQGLSLIDVKAERKYIESTTVYWRDKHDLLEFEKPYSCTSQLCNKSFFDMPFFHYWGGKFRQNFFDHLRINPSMDNTAKIYQEPIVYHRKLWEWVYIAEALYERGCLSPGKKGLAFGVGEECTPDLFASFGCEILATDLDSEEAMAQGWIDSGQNAGGSISKLNKYKFCSIEEFENRVSYRNLDMNHIPEEIKGYDFCWSACALEHLGSLQNGMDFIKNSLKTIKSGGLSIHTTEFNLSSNDETLEVDSLSIYRRKDIEKLISELRAEGHYVWPVDWYSGDSLVDEFVDFPPYGKKDMHLRLRLGEYDCTSIGLIIKKQ